MSGTSTTAKASETTYKVKLSARVRTIPRTPLCPYMIEIVSR
ncbi:MAG TPA: hypothetical protein VHM65_02720 [Candidatus Lustribacter sp.]|nr:hypothetical protein [Candidatus Lustribacter sp.]